MPIKAIPVNLIVAIVGDEVLADVTFINDTEVSIFLDSWTICTTDEFRNKIFSIHDQDGKLVTYTGYMVNRPVLPEHFVEIKPGENIITKITVTKGYRLIKGNKYIIQYLAYNPSFDESQRIMSMMSNKVEITF